MTVERAFPARTSSTTEARRWVAEKLRAWGLDDLVDDASVLVSELVSNAVGHAASDARVTIERDPGSVRVSVEDTGPGLPEAPRTPSDATGGRGLRIVDALSDEWGVDRRVEAKSVWFLLRTDRR